MALYGEDCACFFVEKGLFFYTGQVFFGIIDDHSEESLSRERAALTAMFLSGGQACGAFCSASAFCYRLIQGFP